jgi:hypothetical protein
MPRAWALLGALFIFACSSGSLDHDANGGDYGEFQRVADALPAVCDQTEACYGTRCEGPAEGGLVAEWYYDAGFADLYLRCLQEVAAEEPRLTTWADCLAGSEEDEAACLSVCPETVDACLDAGNAALQACNVGFEAELEALELCITTRCLELANPPVACQR